MESFDSVKKLIRTCMQCGTCTGSCPNAGFMDVTPRKLWRMVLMDKFDAVFSSRTFSLCSSCYFCTLRCPRGLSLTQAMNLLKSLAASQDLPAYRNSSRFYSSFLESVRRHGRVRESEFMTLYFLSVKSPKITMSFAPIGLKLMAKGKVALHPPSGPDANTLAALFSKVKTMEEGS